jgi:hypothetical protein
MTHTEIINLARGWLDDLAIPYGWSLDEMIAYYNDTVNEFCEQTKILVDSTTEAICKLTLAASLAKYTLDSRVIEVLRGRLVTYDRKITRRTRTFMDNYSPGWDSATASSGTPKNFLGDLDTGYITLAPTPDAIDTLWLTVVRFPLAQLTSAILDLAPEIHFKYHFGLLDGICGRAYLKQDAETYDPKKAERHLVLWRATINARMLEEINRNDIDNETDQVPDYLEN